MKKYVLEALGCFAIGFVLFCSILAQGNDVVLFSLVFFVAIFLATVLMRGKTACFFNPAVAFGFAINKKITFKEFWAYFLSEFIGFAVATLIFSLLALISNGFGSSQIYNAYGEGFGVGATIVFVGFVEVVLTTLLVFVYLYADKLNLKERDYALIVAVASALTLMVTFPITMGSVNIAKTLATALCYGVFSAGFELIGLTAILVGCGLLGGLLGKLLFSSLGSGKTQNKE